MAGGTILSDTSRKDRIHGLDALRAIMMLLGLVLHSAVTYSPKDYGAAWPLKDPLNTSTLFDILADFIHVFRMPLFFVIAGFFGALLFYDRSPRRMVVNRLQRVVLPGIVFCPIPPLSVTTSCSISTVGSC
jgi:glucan biosynthesis protein C